MGLSAAKIRWSACWLKTRAGGRVGLTAVGGWLRWEVAFVAVISLTRKSYVAEAGGSARRSLRSRVVVRGCQEEVTSGQPVRSGIGVRVALYPRSWARWMRARSCRPVLRLS